MIAIFKRPARGGLIRVQPITECRRSHYAKTIDNLLIGQHTRVIFQGFTGKQATANATASLAWGTKIVGGVTPGRTGEHLGLPVLPSVRIAVQQLRPDATAVYVAANQAARAIEEAVEEEVPLVVAVAEHVPLHDMLRVGIIARSGTLSYEAVASTTRAGLGQSLCIGVGGDLVPGTDMVEALAALERDPSTAAMALVGEVGGTGELDAAEWIKEYASRTADPKPIVAMVAGREAVAGRRMGHDGAVASPWEPDVKTKVAALEAVGVTVVGYPDMFGEALRTRLEKTKRTADPRASRGSTRQVHTISKSRHRASSRALQQRRIFSLSEARFLGILRRGSPHITSKPSSDSSSSRFLAIGIDRASRRPSIVVATTVKADEIAMTAIMYPFDYHVEAQDVGDGAVVPMAQLAANMGLDRKDEETVSSLSELVTVLVRSFRTMEAYLVAVRVVQPRLGGVDVVGAQMKLGNCARDADMRDESEREAARHGMVYIKLPGASASIGTLVNGAGLAMSTVDGLSAAGGRAANFLDTGGKATSETVRKAFEIVLRDARVRVVFVNIFGGLTLGDMVARGLLSALTHLGVHVPVVVRIRGTNEEKGQRLIRESRLPNLYAYQDFEEAARKAVELAQAG